MSRSDRRLDSVHSWKTVTLSDIATKFVDGPFGSNLKSTHYVEEGVRVIRLQNVGVGEMLHRDLAFISREHYESLPRNHCKPGDVIVGTLGEPNLRACVVPDYLPESLNKADCLLLRVNKRVASPAYVCALLNSELVVRRALALVRGQTRGRISLGRLKELLVPLPPLAEQKRIARILDAADVLRAKRRESLAQLDTLLQSTFLDMFGDRDRPPISIGDPTFGDAADFVLLSMVARLATGHTPDRNIPGYWGGEIPWISLTDIREIDGSVATQTLQSVTRAGIANSSSVILPSGTVCFSRTATVGFVAVMGKEMATSQDFVNWVCGDHLDPIYLMWALRLSRPYLLSKSSGSTHKTIYYRHAEQFQVFLPPLDSQHGFAAIVESVEQQRASQRAHLAELDTLFSSLQSRAFRGDL